MFSQVASTFSPLETVSCYYTLLLGRDEKKIKEFHQDRNAKDATMLFTTTYLFHQEMKEKVLTKTSVAHRLHEGWFLILLQEFDQKKNILRLLSEH